MASSLFKRTKQIARPILNLNRNLRYFSTLSTEDIEKQMKEFDEIKKQLFQIEEKQKEETFGNEDHGIEMGVPKTISDIKKIDQILECDRTLIDFRNEIKSLVIHEDNFMRPRLEKIINNVYLPKLKAKSFGAFLYGGETDETYRDYTISLNEPNIIFSSPNRSRDEVILGIESSFDDSAACLINSFGEIKANN